MRRSVALIVLSLVMYGFGSDFQSWKQFAQMPQEFEPFRPKAGRGIEAFDNLFATTVPSIQLSQRFPIGCRPCHSERPSGCSSLILEL